MNTTQHNKATLTEAAEDEVRWLKHTLIPDLKESGYEATAESFEDAVQLIESLMGEVWDHALQKEMLWPDKPVSRMTVNEMQGMVNHAACLSSRTYDGAAFQHRLLWQKVERLSEAYRSSGDHPEDRMALADAVVEHIAPWIHDYDAIHGKDDGVSDEHVRCPAYAELQGCLDYIYNEGYLRSEGGCMHCGYALSTMCPDCKHL